MYTHQKCHVSWNNQQSDPFSVVNRVKQGGLFSPLLFSIYMYIFILKLKYSELDGHVGLYGGVFVQVFIIIIILQVVWFNENEAYL